MDMDEEIRRARQAAENDPQNPQLLASLGQLLSRAGDLSGAEESVRRAIELNPARALFHAILSHLLVRVGRTAEALFEVQCALDLDPDNVGDMIHLGSLLAKSNEIQRAEQVYQRALEIEPSARVHMARSHFFTGQGRIEEAIDAAERAIELDSQNAEFNRHHERLLARKALPSDKELVQSGSEGSPSGLVSAVTDEHVSDGGTAARFHAAAWREAAVEPKSMTNRLLRLLGRKQRAATPPPKQPI